MYTVQYLVCVVYVHCTVSGMCSVQYVQYLVCVQTPDIYHLCDDLDYFWDSVWRLLENIEDSKQSFYVIL